MLPLTLGAIRRRALRVLCLGAHADDIEIGCGGTLAALLTVHRRVSVHWIVFSGAAPRATEARRSAQQWLRRAHSHTVAVEEFRDGFLPYAGAPLKEYFERLKAAPSPDLIFTHHIADRHQDHRLVADLTWNTFRDHLILEYEVPKYDGGLTTPSLYVPLDEAVCRRKARHLVRAFPSQAHKPWFTADTFLALMRLRGVESASPTGFAEGFHMTKAVLTW